MPEEKFTRCPSCRTVFRVTQAQLELRAGQVRCGHCHTVFDGVAHLVSLAPPPPDADEGNAFDEEALGPPTVTLRSARALEPAPPEPSPGGEPPASPTPPDAIVAVSAVATAPAASGAADAGDPGVAGGTAERRATAGQESGDRGANGVEAPPRRRRTGLLWGIAGLLLALLLAGQAIYHFRDSIAARWPATAPFLMKACAVAHCTVGPPHDIADLSIQASDLQADSAHKGLLILTATVRNRGGRTLAYPYVELSLTDAHDQVVVRRAFAPGEYAGGTADLAAGIPANAEVAIKMFIDASATTQAGYRLYLFYV